MTKLLGESTNAELDRHHHLGDAVKAFDLFGCRARVWTDVDETRMVANGIGQCLLAQSARRLTTELETNHWT